ncbi:MAG: glycerol-3-phosphate dehydrogenase [NAD(P)+] [Saprospiraceae bacterium]|nr:MAG: glycerol-3-phosphate dehydrogenase [NAD(P)+] [Saprospiraceae bacterium]
MPDSAADQPVGVIGAGSFGMAIANLLSHNVDVLLYSRKPQVVQTINETHQYFGLNLSERIRATNNLEELAERCTLLFPVVPSTSFRAMMQDLGPFMRPYHFLIHATKGLDLHDITDEEIEQKGIIRANVSTMSEVILEESAAQRIGCLSGPNLATEIMEGQPTATVIASHFDEVISMGKKVLGSQHFHVFGSHDLLGAELAGAFKNTIAIGSGILKGKGYGKNLQAMLITRGWTEMIHYGSKMGATSRAFFGTAGIGDLIATATSSKSRNFTFGYRLGKGESRDEILKSMPELAEGVRTLRIARHLAKNYKLHVPITEMMYRVVFEGMNVEKAIIYLMNFPYDIDVDFL